MRYSVLPVLLLSIWMTTAKGEDSGASISTSSASASRACLFATQPSSWRVLDSQHLVLWGSSQQEIFLISLFFPISDLRSNEVIAFVDSDNNGRLCGDGRDKLVAPYSKTDSSPNVIQSMKKLTEQDLITLGEQYHLQLLSPSRIKALSNPQQK